MSLNIKHGLIDEQDINNIAGLLARSYIRPCTFLDLCFVSLVILLLNRKSFAPNVSSFSSNNLSISKARSKYPVMSSILWNNFVSHGLTKERENLIFESRTCDVKTMCYIVFISHSLHWRYIKTALQECVIKGDT